jgi:hypothetical protein
MKIPNSRIVGVASNNASFVRMEPAYYAPFYRRVWGIRLQGENLKVEPLEETAHPDAKYHQIDSIEAEARMLQAKFGREMYDMVFPEGEADLRKAIEREIDKDLARSRKLRETSKIPHASFLVFGLTDFERPADPTVVDTDSTKKDKLDGIDRYNKESTKLAIALQTAGFPDRDSCIGADIVKLCEAGVSPEVALRLSLATEVKTDDAIATTDADGNP